MRASGRAVASVMLMALASSLDARAPTREHRAHRAHHHKIVRPAYRIAHYKRVDHARPHQARHRPILARLFDGSVLGGQYYMSRNGDLVHRPVFRDRRPRGATARCRDDSWSFSENHRGTCSHHGGVAKWL